MKRPLAKALFVFFALLIALNFFSAKQAFLVSAFLAAAVIGYMLLCRFGRKLSLPSGLVFLLPALIAGLLYGLHTSLRYIPAVELSGTVMRFEATLYEPAQKSGENYVYYVKASDLHTTEKAYLFSGKLRIVSDEQLPIEPFDTFSVQAKLSMPAQGNGTGFDSRSYYRSKGIFLNAYPISGTLSVTGREEGRITPRPLYYYAVSLRQMVGAILESYLEPRAQALAKGVFLGDKSGLSREIKQDFARSGISHTLAVSGLHISFLLSAVFFVAGKGKRRRGRVGYLAGGLVVLMFMSMVGFSPSIVRAGIMALLICLAGILYREPDPLTSLAVAAGIILIINPFAAHDVSLLLSFFATLGILLFARPFSRFLRNKFETQKSHSQIVVFLTRVLGRLIDILALSLGAAVFTYPVLILFFREISVVAPLANMLVLPLVLVLFSASAILPLISWIAPLAWVASLLIRLSGAYILFMTSKLSSLPFAYLPTHLSYMAVLALYPCALALLWLFYRHLKPRLLTPVLLFVCLIIFGYTCNTLLNRAPLIFASIDTGQGDSLVLIREGHALVIDCGGSFGEHAGEAVLDYLDARGIKTLDAAIVTHFHLDHVSGFTALFQALPPKMVFSPPDDQSELAVRVLRSAQTAGADLVEVQGHTRVDWRGAQLDIVYADTGTLLIPDDSQNERALFVRLLFEGNSLLFMSDISAHGEAYLRDCYPELIDADILKVGHHGSKFSSSRPFLKDVSPEVSVISVGKNNFGHPSPDTLERLCETGSAVFRTDISQTVEIFIKDSRDFRVALGVT